MLRQEDYLSPEVWDQLVQNDKTLSQGEENTTNCLKVIVYVCWKQLSWELNVVQNNLICFYFRLYDNSAHNSVLNCKNIERHSNKVCRQSGSSSSQRSSAGDKKHCDTFDGQNRGNSETVDSSDPEHTRLHPRVFTARQPVRGLQVLISRWLFLNRLLLEDPCQETAV